MAIQLNLTAKHLGVLVFVFDQITPGTSNNRQVKVARSVLADPVLKIRKKHLDATSSLSLFNQRKRMKFNLKYHEAHYLEQLMVLMADFPLSEYDRNVLLMVRSKLNQQLA